MSNVLKKTEENDEMTVQPTATENKKHDRSEYWAAYGIYVFIFVAFLSVCAVAIISTSQEEANKTGFKAITTKTPTAFFDKTYMPKAP